MDAPSSLELFLLAGVEAGARSAYELHRRSGLSVGSLIPAFQRLVIRGWLAPAKPGSRGRIDHALTKEGKQALRGWRSVVDRSGESPPATAMTCCDS